MQQQHTRKGEMRVNIDKTGVQVVIKDEELGIADIDKVMQERFFLPLPTRYVKCDLMQEWNCLI